MLSSDCPKLATIYSFLFTFETCLFRVPRCRQFVSIRSSLYNLPHVYAPLDTLHMPMTYDTSMKGWRTIAYACAILRLYILQHCQQVAFHAANKRVLL